MLRVGARRATCAALFGVAALLFSIVPAAAAGPGSTLSAPSLGPGTVRFDLSKDELSALFVDATDVTVTGSAVSGGGCRFGGELTSDGRGPLGFATVAVNPASCREIIRRGHLSALPGHTQRSVTTVAARARQATTAAPAGTDAAANSSCSAHAVDNWWTDPVNIVVNEIVTFLDWCYDFSSITSCGPASNDWSMFGGTNWYVAAGISTWASQWDSFNCAADTYAVFGNDFFRCPQQAHTRTVYGNSEIVGNYYGAFWSNTNTYSYGDCSNLLSRHGVLE
jgi:hypothetical protein